MDKIKCGILTINTSLMNYGNRLQNYALQRVLERQECEVATVNYTPTYPESSYRDLRIAAAQTALRAKKHRWKKVVNLAIRGVLRRRNRKAQKEKREKYNAFIRDYIKWTSEEYTLDSELAPLGEKFDFMIAGSDQIWNPYWEGTQPIYFMQFVPENKRIAYAASFGVSSIPDQIKSMYGDYLKSIPRISCRENTGCDLVEELTQKKAIQVLDPVFLLEQNDWQKIEEKPDAVSTDKPYILVYFLGDIEKETAKKIKRLQKKNGCRLIYLDRNDKLNSCFASPTEFLYLIHHAAIVCTDSFHGCAFSIAFNRPFVCFQRTLNNGAAQDMSSRLTSLFDLLQCNRYDTALSFSEMAKMDYDEINSILQKEKKKSLEFLMDALHAGK